MPNECWNVLEVRGGKNDLNAFIEKAEGDDNKTKECNMFENLYPTPKKLMNGEGWYDWRVEKWGTKWNPWGPESRESFPLKWKSKNNSLMYGFFTAWSPPIELFKKVSKKHKGLIFILSYREDGNQVNGESYIRNGKLVSCKESETKHYIKNLGRVPLRDYTCYKPIDFPF